MNNTNQFYAGLTPLYHLIYPDWDASMQRQAGMLDSVIRERWGEISTVLDVSCGIGTQAIGIPRLMQLMSEAGFSHVDRLDERFFQPMIMGAR